MKGTQLLMFPGFTLRTPSSWVSFVDKNWPESICVRMDGKDSFQVNLGPRSRPSSGLQSIVVQDVTIQQTVDEENGGRVIEETKTVKSTTVESDMFLEKIANQAAKILIPKTPGKGISAVFFESSNFSIDNRPRTSFVAIHLKPENETKFLDAIRTLEFITEKEKND